MTEAIADTGPILHLHEISEISALSIFDRLEMPRRVATLTTPLTGPA